MFFTVRPFDLLPVYLFFVSLPSYENILISYAKAKRNYYSLSFRNGSRYWQTMC